MSELVCAAATHPSGKTDGAVGACSVSARAAQSRAALAIGANPDSSTSPSLNGNLQQASPQHRRTHKYSHLTQPKLSAFTGKAGMGA